MARDPTALLAEIEQLGGGVIDDWPGIILQYEALVNPESAANRLALGGIGTEEGPDTGTNIFLDNGTIKYWHTNIGDTRRSSTLGCVSKRRSHNLRCS